MELKNLTQIVIGVVVGALLLVSIVIPVINTTTTTERTFTNNGLYHMNLYDTEADFTATWDYTDPNVITIGDEEIDLPLTATYLMTLSGNEDMFVRYGLFTTDNYGIQVYVGESNVMTASQSTTTNMTITVSGGSITFDNGTTPVTQSYSDSIFFISDDTGKYVMKASTDTAYMHEDSTFYGIGRTQLNNQRNVYLEGNIEDGFDVTIYAAGYTTSNETVNATANTKYIDLYELTGVTFTATYGGNDFNASFSQIIVPASVTSELAVHSDSNTISLLSFIPLLLAIALIVGVTALFVSRRE